MIICVEQFRVSAINAVIGIVLVIVRGVIMSKELLTVECKECGFPIDPNNKLHPTGSECICDLKDSVISQEWIDRVNSGETPTRACRSRCYYCVLWEIETCVPKDDYKNKK